MNTNIDKFKVEKIKVLELIYNSIEPDEPENVTQVILNKNDFDRQSISIDSGFSILKKLHKEKIIKLLGGIDEDLNIGLNTNENVIKDYLDSLKENSSISIDSLIYDKESGFLIINDFKIPLSERNSKTISHHIVEFIFNNDLKENNFYSEIAETIYSDELYKPYKYNNACERLQEKIRKITGIENFLVFSSGITGSVKINPSYL
ncbi:hypothetical protein KJ603_01620 [Patescibacteria group bacterium]|nr:hypothetical protein [Patescibacteria group bacterium]